MHFNMKKLYAVKKKKKVIVVSLGCAKNLVDLEYMVGSLLRNGYELSNSDSGDIVIINTCGFIQNARDESLDEIHFWVDRKKAGNVAHIVVTGCLSERYHEKLSLNISDVDRFLPLERNKDIARICDEILDQDHVFSTDRKRILLTRPHVSYLKLSDGCDNRCSYCAIPLIRGHYRSRKYDDIMEEALSLARIGVKELCFISQDTARYGEDLYGKVRLSELLHDVTSKGTFKWLRLLYCHPAHLLDDIIRAVAELDTVVPYLDVPVQHISDRILTLMNRKINRMNIEGLFRKIRHRIPDIKLRTTVMVGFPGETQEEFEELLEWVRETRFERLGAFSWSPEEGTPAYDFESWVPDEIKKERLKKVMETQAEIIRDFNESLVGKRFQVLVDIGGDTPVGRTQWDAPEEDCSVFLYGKSIEEGSLVTAEVTGYKDYDLEARIVGD